MITDRIRLIGFRGRTLWQHNGNMGWEIEPGRFVRRVLRSYGFKRQEIARIMREKQPVEAVPNQIIVRLAHRGETVAYRVSTWIGKRFATEPQVRGWLSRNGFDANEIRSLFDVADTLHIAASEVDSVKALAAHGIRC